MSVEAASDVPYWATKTNVAPIKAEYVIWDRVPGSSKARTNQADDGSIKQDGDALPAPPELDDDDAAEGRGKPGEKEPDLSRSNEEPPMKKQKGGADGGGGNMNRGRQFPRVQDAGARLCNQVAWQQDCPNLGNTERPCTLAHDIKDYLTNRKDGDIVLDRPDSSGTQPLVCPIFALYGACPYGYKCRFLSSHLRNLPAGEGFQQAGVSLVQDLEKLRSACPPLLAASTDDDRLQWLYETKGEMNFVNVEAIRRVRMEKTDSLPITRAYLNSIGEPLDTRADPSRHGKFGSRGGRGGKWGRGGKQRQADSGWAGRQAGNNAAESDPGDNGTLEKDADRAPLDFEVSSSKDTPDVPLKPIEKRRLHFEGGLYLAPLTTVGNLPFRRLCTKYGADITCGEMGLAQEFQIGNKSEWSLVRRHASERRFGIQVCGNRPQTLVAATEAICKECPDLDFIDVNLGCPIDLVVKKGAGSALLDHSTKLGKILKGMNYAAGDVPITIKMRTGIKTGVNTTHKLMPKAVKEWGVSALTIHGRTQQQRYSKAADYDYIRTCVQELRRASEDIDMPAIPIFGNGDAYDHRSYWQNVEETGVDGIMVARGALVKPWLFTELKERRDWDISGRERLDMIEDLARFGLEHWGSDTVGVNNTRRFLCESLSFTYRYVPVGLLERLPAKMNDRPYPFRGRDELETLLASGNAADWVKITSMFLGPPPPEFSFIPKHKSNAYGTEESNG